jgi:hypothetical protein
LLVRSGSTPDIVTSPTSEATGRAVRDAVEPWFAPAHPATAVLVIASHGSWKVDRGGDEADRYDETICPHDCDRGQIGDDSWPPARSGGRRRAVDRRGRRLSLGHGHAGPEGTWPELLSPWIATAGHGAGRRHRPVDRIAASVPQRHLLIAACGDQQSAVERRRGSQVRGLFSSLAVDVALVAHVTLGSLTRDGTHRTVRVRRRRPTAGRQRTDELLDAPVFR